MQLHKCAMARGAAALRQPVPHSFENWPECSTADAAAAPAGQCDGDAVPTVVEVAVLAVDVVFGGEPPGFASGAAPEEMSRTNRLLRSRSQGCQVPIKGSSSVGAPVASYAAASAKPSMDELKALLQEAVTAILAESSLAMLEAEARSAAAQREKLERDELLARRAAVLRRQEALRQRCMRLSSERRAAASDGASAMRAEHAVAAAGPWQNMQLWGKACAIVVDSRSLVFNLEDVDVSEDKVSRQSSGAWEQGPAALDYKRRLAEGAPRGCGAIHVEWSGGSTGAGFGVSVVEPEVSKARMTLPR